MIKSCLQEKTVLAMGMFDGMHIGHRMLVRKTVELGRKVQMEPVIFTFSNHPKKVLEVEPAMLMTADEKKEEMLKLGIRRVEIIEFTREIANTEAETFILNLKKKFNVDTFIAGFNFNFGKKGRGDAGLLRQMGKEHGFHVEIIEPVIFDKEPVSSTRIRNCISSGDVAYAAKLLDAPYSVYGRVVSNKHVGTAIGYPTANLRMEESKLLPPNGVYITRAKIGNVLHNAVTNIGVNPTISKNNQLTIESYLLDFEEDVYGRQMRLFFFERIRSEQKFGSKAELACQIHEDVSRTRQFFSKHGCLQ